MKKCLILNLLVLFLGLSGCTDDPLDVDISGVEVDLDAKRLDLAIFQTEPNQLEAVHQQWLKENKDIYTVYYSDVIGLGDPASPTAGQSLGQFSNDATMRKVYAAVHEQYENTDEIERELQRAFSYYKYHFPKRVVPKIVFCQGGFYTRAFETDSVMGICFDMYLGPDHEIVEQLSIEAFPNFFKKSMKREYIVVDAMKEWTSSEFYDEELFGKTFASQIIYFGKIQYLLDATLVSVPDEVKMKYTPEQLQWCYDNEFKIWKEVIDDSMLHSKDEAEIVKWMSEGPFTTALPRESPARVGIWLGWQIVRAYMEDNPDTSLEELMAEGNVQKILNSYKPRK